MNGLINAGGGKDLSLMTTKQLVEHMRQALMNIAGVIENQVTLMLTEKAYHEIFTYRYRKCRVKKGCGKFRFVVIGPARLTLRRSK